MELNRINLEIWMKHRSKAVYSFKINKKRLNLGFKTSKQWQNLKNLADTGFVYLIPNTPQKSNFRLAGVQMYRCNILIA